MSAHLAVYQYQSLRPREIRVLRIDVTHVAHPQDITTDLNCSLDIVSLDEVDDFDALSYTWGFASVEEQIEWSDQIFTTVQNCYPIYVDGKLALVTGSLRSALRRLRQALHPLSKRLAAKQGMAKLTTRSEFIWIDGLCINQRDAVERCQQVSLMAEIYSKANVVHAYVGEHDESSREGLEAGGRLAEMLRPAYKERFRKQKAMAPEQALGLLPLSQWKAWIKFLCREWFFRTWVMQEIILCVREITLTCGSTIISLTRLAGCLDFVSLAAWGMYLRSLLQEPGLERYKIRAERWLMHGHPLQAANQARLRLRENKRKLPITSAAVYIYQQTQCSDARDRVYGTLGSVAEFSAPVSAGFPVDYSHDTTTREVYIRATRHVLRASRSLAALSLANANSNNDLKLPTWCYDFVTTDAMYRPDLPFNLCAGIREDEQWAATGRACYYPTEESDTASLLKLTGLVFDTIEATVESYGALTSMSKMTAFFEFVLDGMRAHSDFASAIFDASWRTLILDHSDPATGSKEHPAPESVQDVLRRTFTYMLYSVMWKDRTSRDDIVHLRRVLEQIRAIYPGAARALPDHIFLESQISKVEQLAAKGPPGQQHLLDRDFELETWLWRDQAGILPRNSVQARQNAMLAETVTLSNHVLSLSVARQMARTVNGSIAYVASIAKAGDKVCLLSGGPMAYVLRPLVDGTWNFVGEAYVHGIMHGEAWPADPSALMEIILC